MKYPTTNFSLYAAVILLIFKSHWAYLFAIPLALYATFDALVLLEWLQERRAARQQEGRNG